MVPPISEEQVIGACFLIRKDVVIRNPKEKKEVLMSSS